jgi:protocatechuate 3,4-dioxygenase beta subunit
MHSQRTGWSRFIPVTLPEMNDDERSEIGRVLQPLRLDRRRVLQLLGIGGVALVIGCGDDGDESGASTSSTTSTSEATSTTTSSSSGSASTCTVIPEETAGPYPGDGSNGPNVLTEDGVVRSDITRSFGTSSTIADGVPLAINFTILDNSKGCQALAGAAVYIWHCDREGGYSMYSQGVTDENYLRGVQQTDANGRVTFKSIFPAAYSGRWPHIHFEVFASLDQATHGRNKIATSQLALPQDVCTTVYATSGYEQSVRNLSQTSLQRDNVFGDDAAVHQLGTTSGSVSSGYTTGLTVPV